MHSNKKILLASQSPRRHQLLTKLEIDFDVTEINCSEEYPKSIDRYDVPVFLSLKKSTAYHSSLSHDQVLLTADTVVICDSRILEKPKNDHEARIFLRLLSNNTNEVLTGVTLRSKEKTVSFSVSTQVFFSELMEDEIAFYIKKYKPFDKAGAYGIQEWIGMIGVKSINGSYYNVVGLPLHEIYQTLKTQF